MLFNIFMLVLYWVITGCGIAGVLFFLKRLQ